MNTRHTYKQIAASLGCSERTLKRYAAGFHLRPVSIHAGKIKEFSSNDARRLKRTWKKWITSQIKNKPSRA